MPLGAHMVVSEPTVVLPALSRAVPVPRLMIWKCPPPTSPSRHCWLFPPFQAACRQVAPLAALPKLSATIPLVRLTIRYQPPPSGTNCHCRFVLPSQLHCLSRDPDDTFPPLSITNPVASLTIRAQLVGIGAVPRVGICPEKTSFTT